jgi:hypothetical protein
MININNNGETYSIKNSLDELTIGQFEYICSVINEDSKRNKIDRWCDIFVYLGVPIEVVEELDAFYFLEIMKNFDLIADVADENFVNEFEIEGYTYKAYDDKLKITIKEMMFIESFIESKGVNYISEVIGVIFKRTDLTRTEHLDKTHIKHKAKLIRENITADIAMPYINFLFKKLVLTTDMTEINE